MSAESLHHHSESRFRHMPLHDPSGLDAPKGVKLRLPLADLLGFQGKADADAAILEESIYSLGCSRPWVVDHALARQACDYEFAPRSRAETVSSLSTDQGCVQHLHGSMQVDAQKGPCMETQSRWDGQMKSNSQLLMLEQALSHVMEPWHTLSPSGKPAEQAPHMDDVIIRNPSLSQAEARFYRGLIECPVGDGSNAGSKALRSATSVHGSEHFRHGSDGSKGASRNRLLKPGLVQRSDCNMM